MVELTEQQQVAIDASDGRPVDVIDPRTQQHFVLMRADVFGRIVSVPDDFSIKDAYPLMNEVARAAGWDDPEWDSYDVYATGHRP